MDELNDLRCPNDTEEIINILHDVAGQLKGNPKLEPHFRSLIEKIEKSTTGKARLSEPAKRSVVSEIRERVRHVGVVNMDELSGGDQ